MTHKLFDIIKQESYEELKFKIDAFLQNSELSSNRLKMFVVLLCIAKQSLEKADAINQTDFIQELLTDLEGLKEREESSHQNFSLHFDENTLLNSIINKGDINTWIDELKNEIGGKLSEFDEALRLSQEKNAKRPFVEVVDKQARKDA